MVFLRGFHGTPLIMLMHQREGRSTLCSKVLTWLKFESENSFYAHMLLIYLIASYRPNCAYLPQNEEKGVSSEQFFPFAVHF